MWYNPANQEIWQESNTHLLRWASADQTLILDFIAKLFQLIRKHRMRLYSLIKLENCKIIECKSFQRMFDWTLLAQPL